MARAQDALEDGDLGEYQRLVEEAQRLVDEAVRQAEPAPEPEPTDEATEG